MNRIVLLCTVIFTLIISGSSGGVGVNIRVNETLSTETYIRYDVFNEDTGGFVGYVAIQHNRETELWELREITPHGNSSVFDDNFDYIIDYVESEIDRLNNPNHVFLPVVFR